MNSPPPGTPQTADKALWTFATVLIASFLAQLGIGDAPAPGETAEALTGLWSYAQEALVSLVLAAVGGATAFFKANKPK